MAGEDQEFIVCASLLANGQVCDRGREAKNLLEVRDVIFLYVSFLAPRTAAFRFRERKAFGNGLRFVQQRGVESRQRNAGASFVRMSGSGATSFALFADEAARDAAADACPAIWWHLATFLR